MNGRSSAGGKVQGWWRRCGLLLNVVGVLAGVLIAAALATMYLNWALRAEPFLSIPTAAPERTTTGWRDAKGADPLELIKVALTVAAGLGGAVALTVAYRKQELAERDEQRALREEDRALREEERAQARAHRDRYGAAVAQLGHEDAAVRLAGVYALANLADDWTEQRQQCVEVLCAYLRLPWDPKHPIQSQAVEQTQAEHPARKTTTTYGYPNQAGEIEVRRTILRVIADHLRDPHQDPNPDAPLTPGPWSHLSLALTGATLPQIDWTRTVIPKQTSFGGATFAGDASFGGATFAEDASFDRATFTRAARFQGASFAGDAWFQGASFAGDAWFARASFVEDASFARASFTMPAMFDEVSFAGDVSFDRTSFTETASFDQVSFTGTASFDQVSFTGNAWFHGASFTRAASFDRARFSRDAMFDGASFAGDVSFDQASFTRAARFQGASFAGDASFDQASFAGDVSFDQARFRGDAMFDGASFTRAARFHRASFAADVSFDQASFAGDVSFDQARFAGPARLSGSSVHGALLLIFPRIEPNARLTLDGRPWPWDGG